MAEHPIVDAAVAWQDNTLELLHEIVSHETPSSDKPMVDRLIDYLSGQLSDRGADLERLPQQEYGDLLIGRFPGNDQKPLLVMTHIDTVWPVGTLKRLPWRFEGDHAFGPGIYDMKASVAMMLTALDILSKRDGLNRPVTWVINTEEEVGSPVSRPVLEHLAREAEYVLCLEPPVPPNDSLKTERKGVGIFTMQIEGRAAHAGADHQEGISAVEELARQVQRLHALTDYEKGTTLNVGVVSGGTKRNVVAAHAEALIDCRVTTMIEAERVIPLIRDTTSLLPGTTVTVTGELNRPPMERTQTIVDAFQRVQTIGAEIGQEVTEAATGGGSDGNFTAAIGAATIDGLGCPGHGGHADDEHIILSRMPGRVALIAAILENL